jgi:xylulokinase
MLAVEAPKKPGSEVFLPFIEPSGAPVFLPESRGSFLGIGATSSRGSLYRALLEGESMFFREAFSQLLSHGLPINEVLATGGGSRSDLWLQIKADILQCPVKRARHLESGTAGAAIAAGVACGVYSSYKEAVVAFRGFQKEFFPHKEYADLYGNLYGIFQAGLQLVSSDVWNQGSYS